MRLFLFGLYLIYSTGGAEPNRAVYIDTNNTCTTFAEVVEKLTPSVRDMAFRRICEVEQSVGASGLANQITPKHWSRIDYLRVDCKVKTAAWLRTMYFNDQFFTKFLAEEKNKRELTFFDFGFTERKEALAVTCTL